MGYPSDTRSRSMEISLDPVRKAQIVQQALAAFEEKGSLLAAAKTVKVGREALKRWIDSNHEWRERFLEIDEGITDVIEEKAIDLCKDGDQRMVAFMLERRRDRYKQRVEVETKEALTMDVVADRFRQAALANPTLKPTLIRALEMALARIRDNPVLEHQS